MVEIDRGTMPVTRSDMLQTSFERKMRGYLSAYAAGEHEHQFGWKAFRVLKVTLDDQRLSSMVKALGSLSIPQSPRPSLFWFGLRQELNRSNPIEFAWRDGAGQLRRTV